MTCGQSFNWRKKKVCRHFDTLFRVYVIRLKLYLMLYIRVQLYILYSFTVFYDTHSRHSNQAMEQDANLFVTSFINVKSFVQIYFLRFVTSTIRILKVSAAIDGAIYSRSRGTYALLSTNELQKNSITSRTFNTETWLEFYVRTLRESLLLSIECHRRSTGMYNGILSF